MGFSMRMALCVAGLAGAAQGCSFLPCDKGCTPHFGSRDVSDRITVECTGTERQPLELSFVHSCHVGVEPAVSTTPDVCDVVMPETTGELFAPNAREALCKKAGTCRVFRKMGFSEMECKCPEPPTTLPPTTLPPTTTTTAAPTVPEPTMCCMAMPLCPRGYSELDGAPDFCPRIAEYFGLCKKVSMCCKTISCWLKL